MTRLPYADKSVVSIVNVSGSNLAPTGDGKLTCRFRSRATRPREHATNASFYSTQLVRCAAPYMNESGVGEVGEYVDVRLAHAVRRAGHRMAWIARGGFGLCGSLRRSRRPLLRRSWLTCSVRRATGAGL